MNKACGCCGLQRATVSKAITDNVVVLVCGSCVGCAADRPQRRDAIGACAAWFYGFTTADGVAYAHPGTPAMRHLEG